MEGGWGGYQGTTLAGTLSGAGAMPPGGYFYTLQCWEQAVCSQNRYMLPASHTKCDTGCTGRVRSAARKGVGKDRREGPRVGAGQLGPLTASSIWGNTDSSTPGPLLYPVPYLLLLTRGGLTP